MTTNIDKIIVVGDRVLIKPNDSADRTKSGLYLPAGYPAGRVRTLSAGFSGTGPTLIPPTAQTGKWGSYASSEEVKSYGSREAAPKLLTPHSSLKSKVGDV